MPEPNSDTHDTTQDTAPEGADDVSNDAGREPGADARNGHAADTTDHSKLWLEVGKPAAERAAALERENQELRSRATQSPVHESPDDSERVPHGYTAEEYTAIKRFAHEGDPVAKGLLREIRKNEELSNKNDALVGALSLNEQLREISDAGKRKRVREHYQSNQHRLTDIAAAEAEVDREDLRKENDKLREELKRGARRADPNVHRTTERDVPASEAKARTVTREDWNASQSKLEWDNPREFRANQRKVRNREIIVKD